MDLGLGGEEDVVAAGVVPGVLGLAGEADAAGHDRVGGFHEREHRALVGAGEDHHWAGAELFVAGVHECPAGEELVVALELVEVLRRSLGAVDLDEQVDRDVLGLADEPADHVEADREVGLDRAVEAVAGDAGDVRSSAEEDVAPLEDSASAAGVDARRAEAPLFVAWGEHVADVHARAQSTRTRYADAYRLHIEPWLGELPLTEITVGRLRAWQADRLADGVGTIDKARTVLSSVLRHAAESEAIPGNPLTLVRAPFAEHRDSVTPLAPITVERIRTVLASTMDVHVPERIRRGGVRVAGYVVPDERDPLERQRDATIVSILAYAGLRPGELRALRWGDIRNATITVERAARPDGTIKSTKNHERRAVRLLAPLATDLAKLRLAAGDPVDDVLVLPPAGEPTADAHPNAVTWTKTDWQIWARETLGQGLQSRWDALLAPPL